MRNSIAEEQRQILIAYMQANSVLAEGTPPNAGPLAKQEMYNHWAALATILNNIGSGCTKTPMQWRKYWYEKKYALRRTNPRLEISATGASHESPSTVTPQASSAPPAALPSSSIASAAILTSLPTPTVPLGPPPSPAAPPVPAATIYLPTSASPPAAPSTSTAPSISSPVAPEASPVPVTLPVAIPPSATAQTTAAAERVRPSTLEDVERRLAASLQEMQAAQEQIASTQEDILAALADISRRLP